MDPPPIKMQPFALHAILLQPKICCQRFGKIKCEFLNEENKNRNVKWVLISGEISTQVQNVWSRCSLVLSVVTVWASAPGSCPCQTTAATLASLPMLLWPNCGMS